MPKTQKQVTKEIQETRQDRTHEQKVTDRRESQQMKTSTSRAAAALPDMPGPRPGGLAESMANPQVLQDSLARTRMRRMDYEAAKVAAGIKDTRMPANTPGNRVAFAEGATARAGAPMTIGGNPRFAPKPATQVVETTVQKTVKTSATKK